jgi:translation initiation factor 2 beta subunit (eIF-2beta)/eIF-5
MKKLEFKPEPCPWCKGEDIHITSNGEESYFCYCAECGASGPTGLTEKEAQELWNNKEQ